MGKNKSRRKVRADYAARVSAMRRLDNELTKGHRAKGDTNHDRRKADTADNT